jgi:phosphoribosyl 1,2-cyclic phosphate phosphodiesterase
MGLDDVRPISLRQREVIPIYGSADTLALVRRSFQYVFETSNAESTIPKIREHPLDEDGVELFGLRFEPIPVSHGRATIFGYRFGRAAYVTDQSGIPDSSMDRLRNLDVLFLDALRHKPHPTHSTVQQALAYVAQLGPARAFFTHISHDLPHAQTEEGFPENVRLAYDGLQISVEEEK